MAWNGHGWSLCPFIAWRILTDFCLWISVLYNVEVKRVLDAISKPWDEKLGDLKKQKTSKVKEMLRAFWEKLGSDIGRSGVSFPAHLPSLGLKGCSSALWVVPDTGEGSCYAPERVFIQRTRDLCTKRALLAARGTTVACAFGELRRFKEDPLVPGSVSVEGPRHTRPVVGGKPKETSTFSKYLGGQTDGQESFVPLRWRW